MVTTARPAASPLAGVGRGMVWTYVAVVATAGAGLVAMSIALRRLDDAGAGLYSLGAAAGILTGLLDFGLGLTAARAAARADSADESTRDAARDTVAEVHAALLALGLWAGVAGAAASLVLPALLHAAPDRYVEDVVALALMAAAIAVELGTATVSGVAYGRRAFAVTGLATIAGVAAQLGAVFAFVGPLRVVGLALGQVAFVVVQRLTLAVWAHRACGWFQLTGRASPSALRLVAPASIGLLVISGAGLVVSLSDLVVVGALLSGGAVAVYRAGSLIPQQGVYLLWRGYDVVFPGLARTDDRAVQLGASLRLTRVAGFLGGLGLGALAFHRHAVVELFAGRPVQDAEVVMAIVSVTWMLNTPAHSLSVVAIARQEHGMLARVLAVEAVANVALTIVLVHFYGLTGAATATLLTTVVAHVLVIPVMFMSQGEPRRVVHITVEGLAVTAVGAALSLATWATTRTMGAALEVSVTLAAVAVASLGAVALLLRGGADLVPDAPRKSGT